MVSPCRAKEREVQLAGFAAKPSGTGPYRFDKATPHQRMEFLPNTEYWDKARVPKQDRLVLVPMPEASTRTAALISGQVNWIEAPSPDTVARLKTAGMTIVTNPYPHNWTYQLNFVKGPFTDKRVRQAANYALNREDMKELLGGLMLEGYSTVPPVDDLLRQAADLQARHRQGAGAAEGSRLPALQGDVRHLHLRLRPDAAVADERAGEVATWRRPGSRSRCRPWTGMRCSIGARRRRKYPDVHAINVSRQTQDPFNALIRQCGLRPGRRRAANWGHYGTAEMDKQVEAMMAEFDPAKRNALLTRMNEMMNERGRVDLRRARHQPAGNVAQGEGLRAGAELVPGPDAGVRGAMNENRSGALPLTHQRLAFEIHYFERWGSRPRPARSAPTC